MKNGPLFFLGLFSALAISWGGIVLGSHAQLGGLAPYFDENEGQAFPFRGTGVAMRGQMVYADLGCAACHTQQVRRPDFGSDQARGWGDRQSVARDYIHQPRPQLGASRLGPDLANYGARQANNPQAADELLSLLYNGAATHPSYKFLFETREIIGEPSGKALELSLENAPPAGWEVVPSERAQSLVTYLLSLNNAYEYPEARPVTPPAKAETKAAPAVPEKRDEQPIPAAAPDEGKKETKK